MKSILIKFPHDLAAAVQFTIVLRHIGAYRQDWTVDMLGQPGTHSAFRGLCRRSYHDGGPRPEEDSYYHVFHVDWHKLDKPHDEVPSTRVTRCLIEEFAIQPDASLCRYQINVTETAKQKAAAYLRTVSRGRDKRDGRYPVLLLHWRGHTSPRDKDLTSDAAFGICRAAIAQGLAPAILDWNKACPLCDQETVFWANDGSGDLWKASGSEDPQVLAALIDQSSMFIGVDGGPLKVAGATTTPTLGVWTRCLPAEHYDLADNVTHYVPANWKQLGLAQHTKVAEFFQRNYPHKVYQHLVNDLVAAISPRLPRHDTDGLFRCGEFWIRRDNAEQDLVVVRDVFTEDAYRTQLLPAGRDGQVVVDIGAHIGCFAKLWHQKNPQARIICVEACPENLEALRANVGQFAEVVHAACTYEPGPMALLNAVRPNCESTGGSVVVPSSEMETTDLRQPGYTYQEDLRELPKITLEDLIERFGLHGIDVLKLDCEGSEYSILGKTPSLDRVRAIVGEYHDRSRWDALRQERLADWDYRHLHEDANSRGLFHYQNPIWPPLDFGHQLLASWPKLMSPPLLRVAVPNGIGDAVWALTKVPAMLRHYQAKEVHVALCGGPPYRSKPFVERFDFVTSVEDSDRICVQEPHFTEEGVLNWAPSCVGWHGQFDWMLQANRHLESGRRLETWLEVFDTDFGIADRFCFTGREVRLARELEEGLGPYCVFYLGPERGNTVAGHNRGPLWKPEDWGRLGDLCRSLGLAVVVVGAEYDRSYFERHARKHLDDCHDAIGKWHIGQTFSVIQRSRFVIGYQSGIGIFSVYMGIPAAVFWRPHGDSINPNRYLSFSECMASAWAPQEALDSGRYLPLIYTRCSPESIAKHAEAHDWHKT